MTTEPRTIPPVAILCGGCGAAIDVDPYMLDTPLACVHCDAPIVVSAYEDLVDAKRAVAAERKAAREAGSWVYRNRWGVAAGAFAIVLAVNGAGWLGVIGEKRRAADELIATKQASERAIAADNAKQAEYAKVINALQAAEDKKRSEAAEIDRKISFDLKTRIYTKLLQCNGKADNETIARALGLARLFVAEIGGLSFDDAAKYSVAATIDPECKGYSDRSLSLGVRLIVTGQYPGSYWVDNPCHRAIQDMRVVATQGSYQEDYEKAGYDRGPHGPTNAVSAKSQGNP